MSPKIKLITIILLTVVTLSNCTHDRLIKDDEVLQIQNSSTIISSDGLVHDFESVNVRTDTVLGIKHNMAQMSFSRSEVIVIREKQHNILRSTIIGGVASGTVGYLLGLGSAEESDALAGPKAGAWIYGWLGAGVGFYGAKTFGVEQVLFFDSEKYANYVRLKEVEEEENRIQEIQDRLPLVSR